MITQVKQRHARAAAELSDRGGLENAESIVESLTAGLTNLRNLLIKRVHADIEDRFGIDSMLAPMSEDEEQRELYNAKIETEVYSLVVAANEVCRALGAEDETWFVYWLLRLRLGDDVPRPVHHRLEGYRKRSLSSRRLLFSDVLVRVIPEASKAPLIVFKLYPKSVRLAVAVALNDSLRAAELRGEQAALLPAINDCQQCHGRPLEPGDICPECQNPLWKLHWLLSAD